MNNDDIDPLKGNVIMKFTLYGVRAHITTHLKDGTNNHLN